MAVKTEYPNVVYLRCASKAIFILVVIVTIFTAQKGLKQDKMESGKSLSDFPLKKRAHRMKSNMQAESRKKGK